VKLAGLSFSTTDTARNLGFVFDSHLTFSDQISSFSKFCYYHIHERRCIHPYLDFKTASTMEPHLLFTLNLITATLCTTTFQNLKQIVYRLLRTLLPGLWLRLQNYVTSPLFSNHYIGLKSTNGLNINLFLLVTKFLPLLNLLICTA